MPIIQLQYSHGALSHDRKADLAQRLTQVLLAMEGNAKTAAGLAFASVLFNESAPGDWWVAGHTDTVGHHLPGHFIARVAIPEGYMNQAHKSEVHTKVHKAIAESACQVFPAVSVPHALVIIEEIPEGNWGSQGQTIGMASIAKAVGLPANGERFAWVKSYFAAKARQFAAAGYPADVGGLMAADASGAQSGVAYLSNNT